MGENEMIAWIRSQQATPKDGIGIGDDCAVVCSKPSWLISTDMLMDGTHFDLNKISPELAGRKSLAVSLSDIAAMGGVPKHIFISLALPEKGGDQIGKKVMGGIQKLAEPYGVSILGGDTNSWAGPLVINITILGNPGPAKPVLRSGAKPGDRLLVTGMLGGSLESHHLHFEPRIAEALTLTSRYEIRAMADVSDGIAKEAHLLAMESMCRVVLFPSLLPIRNNISRLSLSERIAAAYGDGEDFELLFATTADTAKLILSDKPLEIPITEIGYFTQGIGIIEESSTGEHSSLNTRGFSHKLS